MRILVAIQLYLDPEDVYQLSYLIL